MALPTGTRGRPLRTALVLGLCAALVAPLPAAAGDEARQWLERMAEATRALNYDGTFVYHNDDWMQSMRIIHRADENGTRERLVALTGEPREVIRDRSTVTCILPDDRSVVVGKSRMAGGTRAPAFDVGAGFTNHYHLSTQPGGRVAGRDTQLVDVRPRDPYRYGYRLSVDIESGLLLKSELRTADGNVLEQIEFTSLSTPEHIPDELLEPSVSSEGFTRYSSPRESTPAVPGGGQVNWQATWLPDGFSLSEAGLDPLPTARNPVEQAVYSDGLASLSVFVERLDDDAEGMDGASRMGAVNAYGRMIGEFQITVVGEVPAATVEKVALSVQRRQ